MSTWRVFLSSTFRGLLPLRARLRSLLASDYDVVALEHWPQDERAPVALMEELVHSSDVVVLLLTPRRGTTITNSILSMTENEYRTARAAKVDVLPFIKRAQGRAFYRGRQKRFVEEVEAFHFVAHGFREPDELIVDVPAALASWVTRHSGSRPIAASVPEPATIEFADLTSLGAEAEPRFLPRLERLIRRATQEPQVLDAHAKRELERQVDRELERSRAAMPLLIARMDLRAQSERWSEALHDFEQLLQLGRILDDPKVVLRAGVLMMTLGTYDQADLLLRRALRSPDPADRAIAASIRLWISDYRGRSTDVIKRSELLLPTAYEAGMAIGSGVRHRLARAIFIQSTRASRLIARPLQIRALHELEKAWAEERRAGNFDNPYHALWVYRVKATLAERDRGKAWEEAREAAGAALEAPRFHLLALEGDRLADEEPVQARAKYEEALHGWKALGYSKGTHDVAVRLATLVERVDAADPESLLMAWLAWQISIRLGLADVAERGRQVIRLRSSVAMGDEELAGRLESRSFTVVLLGLRLDPNLLVDSHGAANPRQTPSSRSQGPTRSGDSVGDSDAQSAGPNPRPL